MSKEGTLHLVYYREYDDDERYDFISISIILSLETYLYHN